MNFEHCFRELGFNEKEISVYLALTKLVSASASVVAKRCKIPRSTAYSVLEALVAKGIVSIEHSKKVALYRANQPTAFKRMVDQEREAKEAEADRKSKVAIELAELIGPYFAQSRYTPPKLQFFEGTKNVESMLYDNCWEWQRSVADADCVWWGYQNHEFVEQYRSWLEYYWAKILPDESVKLFTNKSKIEKQLKGKVTRREVRLVPEDYNFTSTIWILGEYVVNIATGDKPHFAFQLKDEVFARNQRQVFQLLWQLTS